MFRSPRPSRSTRSPRVTLDALLGSLPGDITVYLVGGTYFVVAATGLFVIAENPIDVTIGAGAAATGADRIRALLNDKVPFVPFVDAVVVSDELPTTDLPALVVPQDLVVATILGGPAVIDAPTLQTLSMLDFPVLR